MPKIDPRPLGFENGHPVPPPVNIARPTARTYGKTEQSAKEGGKAGTGQGAKSRKGKKPRSAKGGK